MGYRERRGLRGVEHLATGAKRIACITTVAVCVSGCGGSTSTSDRSASSARSSSPGTPAQFVSHADGICRQFNTQINRNQSRPGTPDFSRVTFHNAQLERADAEHLESLTPPSRLAVTWKQMNVYRRTLATELFALVEALNARDQRRVHTLALSKLRVHEKLLRLASIAGFKDCAQVGTQFKAPPARKSQSPPAAAHKRGST
jgi:hypothetical protein